MAPIIEQLRSKAWKTRAAATRELKRKGLPERGDDYELREIGGSWQLCQLEEEPPPPADDDTLFPPVAEWLAEELAPGDVVTPTEPEPEPEPEPEVVETPPGEPPTGTDLSFLPTQAPGYYSLRINADYLRQNSIVAQALEVSRQVGFPVEVIDPNGTVLRLIDAAAVRAKSKTTKGAAPPLRSSGGPTSAYKQKGIELAKRPEGVTREQLGAEVTDRAMAWTTILKEAGRDGWVYSTSAAPTGGKSRTVYYLRKA